MAGALGFNGSGFFNQTAVQVKDLLKQNGLTAPSMHTDLDTLQQEMGEAAHVLGAEFVTLPAIPGEKGKHWMIIKNLQMPLIPLVQALKKRA
ncbi:MAG: hypothetical protein ABUT20_28700 [Bacteroidota bacterium]